MSNELIIRANTDKLKAFVAHKFESGQLDNSSLVQLIELADEKHLHLKKFVKENQPVNIKPPVAVVYLHSRKMKKAKQVKRNI